MRPEVIKFAEMMELKMKNHDDIRGDAWKKIDPATLLRCLRSQVDELEKELINQSVVAAAYKAADVGNFAMMVSFVIVDRGM